MFLVGVERITILHVILFIPNCGGGRNWKLSTFKVQYVVSLVPAKSDFGILTCGSLFFIFSSPQKIHLLLISNAGSFHFCNVLESGRRNLK